MVLHGVEYKPLETTPEAMAAAALGRCWGTPGPLSTRVLPWGKDRNERYMEEDGLGCSLPVCWTIAAEGPALLYMLGLNRGTTGWKREKPQLFPCLDFSSYHR